MAGVGGDVVDPEVFGAGGDGGADSHVVADAEALHLAFRIVPVVRELGPVRGVAAVLELEVKVALVALGAGPGEGGGDRYAVAVGRGGHPGEVAEGGHPVPEGDGVGDLVDVGGVVGRTGDFSGPADDGGGADAGLPHLALDAFHVGIGLEGARVVAFVVGAVVGGEDAEGVVVDAEVLERAEDVGDGLVDAADHADVLLFGIRPAGGDVGMREGVDHAAAVGGAGVADLSAAVGGGGPLDAAGERVAVGVEGRVGDGGTLHFEMRGVVGQIEEEGLGVAVGGLGDDFLLRRGGPGVGGVEVGGGVGDLAVVVVDEGGLVGGAVVREVLVAVGVEEVAEKAVEAAVERVGGEVLGAGAC